MASLTSSSISRPLASQATNLQLNATVQRIMRNRTRLLILAFLGSLFLASVQAEKISEPDTLFYGKVYAQSGNTTFPLRSGTLSWSIGRSDEAESGPLSVSSQLEALAGDFSYRIRIPHTALIQDAATSIDTIPLPHTIVQHAIIDIRYNGLPATVAPPAEGVFKTAQTLRAGLVRLDLLVTDSLPDGDGDGLPDAWEKAHGFDAQLASDALEDSDGDGFSNLHEFQNGTDPHATDKTPTLTTKDHLIFEGCRTGLHLEIFDPYEDPAALRVEFHVLPALGYLRSQDSELIVGPEAVVPAADLSNGQLIFDASAIEGDLPDSLEIQLTLSDRENRYAAVTYPLKLHFYSPDRTLDTTQLSFEQVTRRLVHQTALNEGHVVWDFASLPQKTMAITLTGVEAPQLYSGGKGGDRFAGGRGDDAIVFGIGDDVISGNHGSDRFILASAEKYADTTITDFDLSENDRIDLSAALGGNTESIDDVLHLERDALHVDLDTADGPGEAFTIHLPGNAFDPDDLMAWLVSGHLIAPGLGLSGIVTIAATSPVADETMRTPGQFTLRRVGSLEERLSVQLSIGGTATNGVDYAFVESALTFNKGQAIATIDIVPHEDNAREVDEIVEIRLLEDEGYTLGTARSAQIIIEDRAAQVSIEPLVALGTVDPPAAASVVLKRSGDLEHPLLIPLTYAGTGKPGIDYKPLPSFLTLESNEPFKILTITPMSHADFSHGSKTIQITIAEDETYKRLGSGSATIGLIERQTTYDEWLVATGKPAGIGSWNAYAFPDGLTHPVWKGDQLRIYMRTNLAATDVLYTAEVSEDLRTWSGDSNAMVEIPVAETPNRIPGTRVFQVKSERGDSPKQFVRIRASKR